MRNNAVVRRVKARSWVGAAILLAALTVLAPVHNAAAAGYVNAPSLYQPVAFGSAPGLGTRTVTYDFPVVGMASTPDGKGLWLVSSDGGVFAFGDAVFYGSAGSVPLAQPVVGMAATPDGRGYWLVASDGGVFAFGDAAFYGSMGGTPLNKPIIGIAAAPDGKGYWLVASDGGVFSFGSAPFDGSMGGKPLDAPIVGLAAASSGYWMVAADGGVFAFGRAPFAGSLGGHPLNAPIVGMAGAPVGHGYWLAGADGGVFAFGQAVLPRFAGKRNSATAVSRRLHRRPTRWWRLLATPRAHLAHRDLVQLVLDRDRTQCGPDLRRRREHRRQHDLVFVDQPECCRVRIVGIRRLPPRLRGRDRDPLSGHHHLLQSVVRSFHRTDRSDHGATRLHAHRSDAWAILRKLTSGPWSPWPVAASSCRYTPGWKCPIRGEATNRV